LIFGRQLFRELARNPEVRGYVGTSANGIAAGERILNDEAVIAVLRDVLGIPNIHVGQARQDTAVPGATSSESYIWTGDSLFMGILRGSDAIVQKSGNVKGMPVAALNLLITIWLAVSMTALIKLAVMFGVKKSTLSMLLILLLVSFSLIVYKICFVRVVNLYSLRRRKMLIS
jgi:hypothetical protein